MVRQVCFAALARVDAAGVEIDVVCESHLVYLFRPVPVLFILASPVCGCGLLSSWLATLRVFADIPKP